MKTFLYSTITVLAVVGSLIAFPREKPSLDRMPVSVQTTTVPTRKDVQTIIRVTAILMATISVFHCNFGFRSRYLKIVSFYYMS